MKLHERLKIARKKSNLKQKELADKLEIGIATLQRYEKDSSKIPFHIVSKIAYFCDVEEFWLYTGDDSKIHQPSETKTMSSKITKVIIEHQDVVKNFKDHERAKEFNEMLVEIETEDPEGYEELFKEAKTISKTIKRLKGVSAKKTS